LPSAGEAFHAVCGRLELFAHGRSSIRACREKIIEFAVAGEKDADRLTARVLAES
jgi:hypothetical protein